MGKFLDKFKGKAQNFDNEVQRRYGNQNRNAGLNPNKFSRDNSKITNIAAMDSNKDMKDDFYDEDMNGFNDPFYDNVGIQPAQKPESFHHFILENQYKDLERSIRGFKDVFDKETQTWKTIRKQTHCFTDEEAEEILRTAQSHLATDIKLGRIKEDVFGDYMDALYKQIDFLFESIAENEYGRYGSYDEQYRMKRQNLKIFLELWTRIQANYSRSIGGSENNATHNSVKGQESLQGGNMDFGRPRGMY